MLETYFLAHTIHLLLAIIFIGFVFTDIVVLSVLQKEFDSKMYKKIKNTISSRAKKIFPLSMLLLILTGGLMLPSYIDTSSGIFETSLQKLLSIKIILALIIASGILYSLSMRFLKKPPHPLMTHFHKLALVLGVIIVIFAKLMFII